MIAGLPPPPPRPQPEEPLKIGGGGSVMMVAVFGALVLLGLGFALWLT
jgi:hypothetical protein